jgi:hypothetical protein
VGTEGLKGSGSSVEWFIGKSDKSLGNRFDLGLDNEWQIYLLEQLQYLFTTVAGTGGNTWDKS